MYSGQRRLRPYVGLIGASGEARQSNKACAPTKIEGRNRGQKPATGHKGGQEGRHAGDLTGVLS